LDYTIVIYVYEQIIDLYNTLINVFKIRVKYVFGPSSFSEIWNQSLIKIFDQFSLLSLKMREFSPFNQILLSLSDVSSAFYDNIW